MSVAVQASLKRKERAAFRWSAMNLPSPPATMWKGQEVERIHSRKNAVLLLASVTVTVSLSLSQFGP